MSEYKTVLVSVDMEGGVDQVLTKTTELVTSLNTKLVILNVGSFAIPGYEGVYGTGLYATADYEVNFEEVESQLRDSLTEKVKEHGLPTDNIVIEFGRPVDKILEVAEREAAELIVLGSHGKHGISLILGSTTTGVLHRSNIDVLALRIKE